eukprot:GHVN01022250.1.p1 GENE.GHVN01022250.1~~GHVN01022250.1.p1  ORF type:complete len:118 (-),score=8.74 GHVN01022250.1:592-945(-)
MSTSLPYMWSNQEVTFGALSLDLLGVAVAIFLLLVIGSFFVFHIWLTSQNMTTIELCEKFRSEKETNPYNLGYLENIKETLGDNPALWLVPLGQPTGNGLTFKRVDDELQALNQLPR